jgi:hypothetical protein
VAGVRCVEIRRLHVQLLVMLAGERGLYSMLFVWLGCVTCRCNYREVVTDLIDEYKAAERADYVTYGGSGGAQNMPPGAEA